MVRSTPRDPDYSGTTSGEWNAPSLSEYISAFATESDQDETQVSELSGESKSAIASKTLMGESGADTADDLRSFPVVTTSNKLHEGALDAVLSRAPQADYLNSDQADSLQGKSRSLLEDEFDREVSRNALPAPVTRLAEDTPLEDDDGPWTIHGVALAEDELTRTANGLVSWPADELREATASLEGKPVTANHPENEDGGMAFPPDVEDTIGRVESVGYRDGTGVVYEATLSDRETARKVRDGVLDVSPDVGHQRGEQDPETGAYRAVDPQFFQLGVVSLGAGPGNTAELGPSRALASLSASDIGTMLADGGGEDPEVQDSDEPAESGADPADDTPKMSDPDTPDNPEQELQEVKARLSETLERNQELEQKNERLEAAATDAGRVYAEALFTDDGPVTPDEAVDMWSPTELQEKYEASEEAEIIEEDDEPDVQSGDSPDETPDEAAEEVEQLEESLEAAEAADMPGMADHYRTRLDAVKGGD